MIGLMCADMVNRRTRYETPILMHSALAQPVVQNEGAGMRLENVLNVVRGVHCVCVVCVVCGAVCGGVFLGSFLSPVLSRFNGDSEESAQCSIREKSRHDSSPGPPPHL